MITFGVNIVKELKHIVRHREKTSVNKPLASLGV